MVGKNFFNKKYGLFGVALMFASLSVFLQVSPASTSGYIEQTLLLKQDEIVNISGLYFLVYAILQIPNGIAFDKYGLKYFLPLGLFLTVVGSILYWQAFNSFSLGLSRAVVGAGCSIAYIAAIFVAAKSFQPRYLPICIGLIEGATTLGAILAGNAYSGILKIYGWDSANIIVILFSILVLLFSLAFIKDKNLGAGEKRFPVSFKKTMHQSLSLFKNKSLCGIFVYSFFTWLIIMTFAGYWAKSYFINMHSYSTEKSLGLGEIYWGSFLVANLIIGYFVTDIKACKKYIIGLSLIAVITFIVMVVPILFNYYGLVIFSIFAGISASGVVLAFALIPTVTPVGLSGTAVAINNTFVVLGGLCGQVLFGVILSDFSLERIVHIQGINEDYYSALLLFPASAVLALVAIFYALSASRNEKVIFDKI